jgi:hypothetical protein
MLVVVQLDMVLFLAVLAAVEHQARRLIIQDQQEQQIREAAQELVREVAHQAVQAL